jgi:hypothetical protein
MLATAAIAHSARGRTRYKVTARRRDAGYFVSVEQQLSKVSEVESVETNPLTGSILVYHHCSIEELNAYAEKGELFKVNPLRGDPSICCGSAVRSWTESSKI